MYVQAQMSSGAISILLERENIMITPGHVLTIVRENGFGRTRAQASRLPTNVRTCRHCNIEFMATSTRKYCGTCAPDRSAYFRIRYYGLSQPEFDAMLAKQVGLCSLCKEALVVGGATNLNVDHCHVSGKVRGLLCHRCNMIVGFLDKSDDCTETLKRIENYIKGEIT